MSKTVEFFYDFTSPWSYVAYTQLSKLEEQTGCEIVLRPALLGGVFKSVGNSAPANVPAKGAYMFVDLGRYAKRYDIPFNMNNKFPVMTVPHMRGALVAERDGYLKEYTDAMFKAMWVDNKDLTNPAVIAEVVTGLGVDPAEFGAAIQDPDIKLKLREVTDELVSRGAFGMPTMYVGDEMFFGQDRLEFVAEALMKA